MSIKAQKLFLFLATLFWVGGGFVAKAEEVPEFNAALPQLPPWSYTEEEHAVGILPEILSALSAELNKSIPVTVMPYARMVRSVDTGQYDIAVLFHGNISPEAGRTVVALYDLETAVFMRSDDLPLDEQTGPVRIAALLGAAYDPSFEANKKFAKVYTNSYEQSVRLFAARRVDGVVGPRKQIEYLLAQSSSNLEGFRIVKELAAMQIWLHLSSKMDDASFAQLRQGVRALSEAGKIDEIVERYLAEWGYLYADEKYPTKNTESDATKQLNQ